MLSTGLHFASESTESLRYPMARNSRLNVCLATTTRNSSKIHWQRSTIRQRTTPCTAGIGPLSSIAASAARCAPFRRDGCPGGLQSISPSGPWALNFITQSRTIWSVTPPIFAASVRTRAVVNRRQRQKPPGLRPILRPPRGGPHHPRIKISPKWNGHGEPPALATLNQTHADSRIPPPGPRLLRLRYQFPLRTRCSPAS